MLWSTVPSLRPQTFVASANEAGEIWIATFNFLRGENGLALRSQAFEGDRMFFSKRASHVPRRRALAGAFQDGDLCGRGGGGDSGIKTDAGEVFVWV